MCLVVDVFVDFVHLLEFFFLRKKQKKKEKKIVCLFVCVLFVYVMMHGGFLFFVHLLFEIFVDGQ